MDDICLFSLRKPMKTDIPCLRSVVQACDELSWVLQCMFCRDRLGVLRGTQRMKKNKPKMKICAALISTLVRNQSEGSVWL